MIRDGVRRFFGQEEGSEKQYIWNVHEVRYDPSTGDVSIWGQEEKDYGPHKEFKFELVSTVDVLGVNTARITSQLQHLVVIRIRSHSAKEAKKRGAVVARYKESGGVYKSVLVFYEKVHEELM